MDERTCKKCHHIKTRIQDGFFDAEEKNKRFVDTEGKLWNGNTCPSCNHDRVKIEMQKIRTIKEALENGKPNS
jgi:hypothetical protein